MHRQNFIRFLGTSFLLISTLVSTSGQSPCGLGGEISFRSAAIPVSVYDNCTTAGQLFYILPDGISEAEVQIYNLSGQLQTRQNIPGKEGAIDLNTEQWVPGLYYVIVAGAGLRTPPEPFVVLR